MENWSKTSPTWPLTLIVWALWQVWVKTAQLDFRLCLLGHHGEFEQWLMGHYGKFEQWLLGHYGKSGLNKPIWLLTLIFGALYGGHDKSTVHQSEKAFKSVAWKFSFVKGLLPLPLQTSETWKKFDCQVLTWCTHGLWFGLELYNLLVSQVDEHLFTMHMPTIVMIRAISIMYDVTVT